jgi:hypothetical protein
LTSENYLSEYGTFRFSKDLFHFHDEALRFGAMIELETGCHFSLSSLDGRFSYAIRRFVKRKVAFD